MSEHFDPELEDILPGKRRNAARSFFGGLLMVVGGLMATLCGLCSALYIVATIIQVFNSQNAGDLVMSAIMFLVVGGVPTAIGAGLFWLGRRMRRAPAAP